MLFIFDWDGTLCDSTRKITTCLQGASRAIGLPDVSEAEVLNIIGLGLPEAIKTLYPQIEQADIARLRDAYSERFLAADSGATLLFDGVIETLAALKRAGAHIAIATGKSRRGLNRVLAELEWLDYFDGSRCADETASKPNPLMLHQLLDEFVKHPEDAVLIGDTEYDMAMAKSAGMPRIAVSYGAHHLERLRPYKPVLCVDRIGDILGYLKI